MLQSRLIMFTAESVRVTQQTGWHMFSLKDFARVIIPRERTTSRIYFIPGENIPHHSSFLIPHPQMAQIKMSHLEHGALLVHARFASIGMSCASENDWGNLRLRLIWISISVPRKHSRIFNQHFAMLDHFGMDCYRLWQCTRVRSRTWYFTSRLMSDRPMS